MGSYRDVLTGPNVLNVGTLHADWGDDMVRFQFTFRDCISLDREGIVGLVAELQSWLDLQASIADRRPLERVDGWIYCPYCDRRWKEPVGRKAGFVLAGIYRHVEACRFDQMKMAAPAEESKGESQR